MNKPFLLNDIHKTIVELNGVLSVKIIQTHAEYVIKLHRGYNETYPTEEYHYYTKTECEDDHQQIHKYLLECAAS